MSVMGAIMGAIQGAIIGWVYGGPWGAVAGAVIGAVAGGVLPGILAPDAQQMGAPDLSPLSWTSNEIGTPIPDLLGTSKFTGTLMYFGGERSEAQEETTDSGGKGGGGGDQTYITGYKYYMSWAVGLCVGPVDELYTVFKNDDVVWSGNSTRPVSGGQETIVIPDFGSMTFFFGTSDQAAAFYLREAAIDDPMTRLVGPIFEIQRERPAGSGPVDYSTNSRNLCWAFFLDCYIGEYNRMPTMRFVIRKTPEIAFSEHHQVQTLDYNPAHAVYYILNTMVGLPSAWLDSDSFAAAAATLKAESRGISINFNTFQSALDYISTITAHVDMVIRYGTDGKWHPKLIRNDYTPALLPLIDEETVLDDPSFSRPSWINTVNEIKVQYTEIVPVRYLNPDMAIFHGGVNAADQVVNTIDYIGFASKTAAVDFGDLTVGKNGVAGAGSETIGVMAGGGDIPGYTDDMEYVTFATQGNAVFFGDLLIARSRAAGAGSATRGVFAAGADGSTAKAQIEYITFATTANSQLFGSITGIYSHGGASSPTKAIFAGHQLSNTAMYTITIATLDAATEFGDLVTGRAGCAAAANSITAVIGGGNVGGADQIEYVTFATLGNAVAWGNLSISRVFLGAAASLLYGVFAGGVASVGAGKQVRIDNITFATQNNATEWGNLTLARYYIGGCSSCHGGIA